MLSEETIRLHGHQLTYLTAGDGGSVIVLVHGITGSSATWNEVGTLLAEAGHTVIAPDLFGHGSSAKPRGDYSLGAHASGIRDLLTALGHDRATFVGHSLGGGIAMQLAYQFPDYCERLVLVSSGGLGREVHALLRAASLPGAEVVMLAVCAPLLRDAGDAVARACARIGLRPGPDLEQMWSGYSSLADPDTRRAFLATLRAVIDHGGQRVNASDRLYLAQAVPTLVVWGERDRVIPVDHGRAAHARMPGSRLTVFDDAGHFPYRDRPRAFATTLLDFIGDTEPAQLDPDRLRSLLLRGQDEDHADPTERPGRSLSAS